MNLNPFTLWSKIHHQLTSLPFSQTSVLCFGSLGISMEYLQCIIKELLYIWHERAHFAVCSPSNTNIAIDAESPATISKPTFPDGSGRTSCIWQIQAPENFRLAITIEALNLNGADDYLAIRDGASRFSPLIGKYGPCAKGSLTLVSSGRSAFLQLESAVYKNTDEIKISYSPTDPGKKTHLCLHAKWFVTTGSLFKISFVIHFFIFLYIIKTLVIVIIMIIIIIIIIIIITERLPSIAFMLLFLAMSKLFSTTYWWDTTLASILQRCLCEKLYLSFLGTFFAWLFCYFSWINA